MSNLKEMAGKCILFNYTFFFFWLFKAVPMAHGGSRMNLPQSCSCQAIPQPQQCQNRANSATYTTAQILNPLREARD